MANAPPTPPTDAAEASPREELQEEVTELPKSPNFTFTGEDAQALLAIATDLLDVLDENKADAWQEWAKAVRGRQTLSPKLTDVVSSIRNTQLKSGRNSGNRKYALFI